MLEFLCGWGDYTRLSGTQHQGYAGKGYELRERRTWAQYPQATQDALVELPIDMVSLFPETMEQWDAGVWPGSENCVVKEGTYLIGNHSDELTVSMKTFVLGRIDLLAVDTALVAASKRTSTVPFPPMLSTHARRKVYAKRVSCSGTSSHARRWV